MRGNVYEDQSKKNTNEFWRWTASDLANGIRTKAISSYEVVSSCLARIDQINPKVKALAEVFHEEAINAARNADADIANGKILGPLHGVPIATKMNTDQANHVTTDGVNAFQNNLAEKDGAPIANLRKNGAVFIGRSNVPAFSLRWFTTNDLHGRTLNPWDANRTPGGSSGGASSAIATGMVSLAQGNDIAGSIRYPAYACGIMGLRPTVGRIPNGSGDINVDLPLASQIMAVQGPLARSVADLRLGLATMSAYHPRDPFHASVALKGKIHQRPLKIGMLRDIGVYQSSAVVNHALDKAANYLRNAGYIVEEVELPLFEEAYKLWMLLVFEDLKDIEGLINKFGDEGAKLNLKYNYQVGKEVCGEATLEKYKHGYARRGTLIAKLQQFLQDYSLLLLPVSGEQAVEQDKDIESLESNRSLLSSQWPMMSIPLLGFPAMSIPISIENGLPTGVQILGDRFREDTILEAAEIIEAQTTISTPIDPKF
ncbi:MULTISPECIES: amidase [Paraliobacillus]|uniref:amidase n=1 Tax=Paraliobacillus TaxID=200903 RepID=UPI000DD3C9FD|nr:MULTISPECIES: amidase [Paraliobacillus]